MVAARRPLRGCTSHASPSAGTSQMGAAIWIPCRAHTWQHPGRSTELAACSRLRIALRPNAAPALSAGQALPPAGPAAGRCTGLSGHPEQRLHANVQGPGQPERSQYLRPKKLLAGLQAPLPLAGDSIQMQQAGPCSILRARMAHVHSAVHPSCDPAQNLAS